ncbi:MAG: T9SS type A sorting domain-containing protein [Chitinophagaceae bacterium]|nr:T9SS type A sorting domain-containing protein [Chitinophagaceae bacterium]
MFRHHSDYHNGSATATTATGSGFTTFSPFGISNDPTVLPVKFGNVKAYQQGSGIKVDWSNLTESGVVNYTIERSANGQLFTPLGTVNPTANNSNRADYSYFDAAPLTGINFYRIQSLEVDGKKLFSTIVRVSTKAGQTDITIYPNPVSGNRVSFQATALPKGQYMVRVTNAAGQQVMSKSLLHTGGSVTEVLELPATIKTGMYNILLSGADIKLTKTFIIR